MKEKKYEDHPFRERLNHLMFSAHKVQGLSYSRMAHDAGIGTSAMNSYRQGEALPGAENLLKIADYFGVSADYLLGREGYEIGEEQ